MTRWLTILSAYKIKIKYIASNKNTSANILSQKFIKDKNEDKLKQAIPNKFINKSTFPAEELSNEPTLEEKQNILRQYHDLPIAILVSRKHYAKCRNNTHSLDSNNSSLTTSKAMKTAKDTKSTDIL